MSFKENLFLSLFIFINDLNRIEAVYLVNFNLVLDSPN